MKNILALITLLAVSACQQPKTVRTLNIVLPEVPYAIDSADGR